MKAAYADPPYIGQAKKHYNCEEIDHVELINRLTQFDAWALSCSEPSRYELEKYCRDDLGLPVRVGIWVKPFCSFKKNVNPAYAFEPVIFYIYGKRRHRQLPTIRDWVSSNITTERGVHGAKPDAFNYWLFRMLDLRPGDEFHDLYPGSGAVSRAWERYSNQSVLIKEM